MLTLCLSAILLTAPIPKVAEETTLRLVITNGANQKKELVFIKPDGTEIKRIKITEPKGQAPNSPLSVSKDGKQAVISVLSNKTLKGGKMYDYLSNGYLVDLENQEKPIKLFEDKFRPRFFWNRKGTAIYGSEWDQNKPFSINQWEMKSYRIDMATKVESTIPLPSAHQIIGIDDDENTVVTNAIVDNRSHAFTASTKTWKPTMCADKSAMPLCISPDGQKILVSEKLKDEYFLMAKTLMDNKLTVYDLKTNNRYSISKPPDDVIPAIFVFSPDGKKIAMVGMKVEKVNKKIESNCYVFTCNTDGGSFKEIYKTVPNVEWLMGLEWK